MQYHNYLLANNFFWNTQQFPNVGIDHFLYYQCCRGLKNPHREEAGLSPGRVLFCSLRACWPQAKPKCPAPPSLHPVHPGTHCKSHIAPWWFPSWGWTLCGLAGARATCLSPITHTSHSVCQDIFPQGPGASGATHSSSAALLSLQPLLWAYTWVGKNRMLQ